MLRGTSHARRSVRPQRCLPTVDLVYPGVVPVLCFVSSSSTPRSPSAGRHSFAALRSDTRPPPTVPLITAAESPTPQQRPPCHSAAQIVRDRLSAHRRGAFRSYLTPRDPPGLRSESRTTCSAPCPGRSSSAVSFAPTSLRKRRFCRGPPRSAAHRVLSAGTAPSLRSVTDACGSHAVFRSASPVPLPNAERPQGMLPHVHPQPFQLQRSPLRSGRSTSNVCPDYLPRSSARRRSHGHCYAVTVRQDGRSPTHGPRHPCHGPATVRPGPHRLAQAAPKDPARLPSPRPKRMPPPGGMARPARRVVRFRRLVPRTAPPHIRGWNRRRRYTFAPFGRTCLPARRITLPSVPSPGRLRFPRSGG